jgi:hypothetical protein
MTTVSENAKLIENPLSLKLLQLLEIGLKSNSLDSAKACFDAAHFLNNDFQVSNLQLELYILADQQGYQPSKLKLQAMEPHNEPNEIPFFDVFATNESADY